MNLFISAYTASQILSHSLDKSQVGRLAFGWKRQYLHDTGELRSAKVGINHAFHVVGVEIMVLVAGLGRTHHADGEFCVFAGAGGKNAGPCIECHGGWVDFFPCGGGAWVLVDPVAEGAYGLSVLKYVS